MNRFGPTTHEDATVFRLWAPDAEHAELLRPDTDPLVMEQAEDGFFTLTLPGAPMGMRYMFRVNGHDVPDPAARAQARDAVGWSLLEPPLPAAPKASPRPWREAVIAEVHVGAVTPEGTFKALIERLDHFIEAGYTAIELMPVGEFPGARNWGYDGVLLFAPDRAYGTPEDLRALVDAAHDRGLAILLDVVYNHFGPEGNFLPHYASDFFTSAEETPWGAAIDLANPIVRTFFLENVAMWLGDYDFDGLRFDAVHAFSTSGADTFLAEIAETGRRVKPDAWLVLENDNNAARWLARDERGRARQFDAQWNDDIHHALHVVATGEDAGYYTDYADDPKGALGRALAEGFVYQGEPSAHRGGIPRGEPSDELPPEAFVAFSQNHDQVGNRPLGDRLASALPDEKLRLLRFVLLLSPQVPLLFMGEEAACASPFPFFCDFEDPLAEAVRKGRQGEFADFFREHGGKPEDLPDPLSPATFESAKLPWERFESDEGKAAIARFRELINLRRRWVWPRLAETFEGADVLRLGTALLVDWRFADGGVLRLAINPDDEAARLPARGDAPAASVGEVGDDGEELTLGPWAGALWSTAGQGAA